MDFPHNILLAEIQKKIELSSSESIQLQSAFQVIHTSKHQVLIETGSVAQHLYFIVEGIMRCFQVEESGNELTTELVSDKCFLTSFESFVQQQPSRVSLHCVTNCILLQISKKTYDDLYSEIAGWADFCRSVYENNLLRNTQRISDLQRLSATDRYDQLMKSSPELVQQVPIKYLASYLGIRPQSLSRIRAGH